MLLVIYDLMGVVAKCQDPGLSVTIFKYARSTELCFKKDSAIIMYSTACTFPVSFAHI